MDGAEDQVPRLGGGQRRLDGLQVPHLAHQNHVRVLPQGGTEAGGEAPRVPADLPLVDDALFRGIDVLDGVLQGEDVLGLVPVDLVEDCRQGGGLAGAGFAGDEHQPLAVGGKFGDDLGQAQLGQIGNMVVQKPDGGGPCLLLAEEVHPAADPGDGQRQVQFAHGLRLADLGPGQLPGGLQAAVHRQRRAVHFPDGAVHPVAGRQPPDQMDVRRPVPSGSLYVLFNSHIIPFLAAAASARITAGPPGRTFFLIRFPFGDVFLSGFAPQSQVPLPSFRKTYYPPPRTRWTSSLEVTPSRTSFRQFSIMG